MPKKHLAEPDQEKDMEKKFPRAGAKTKKSNTSDSEDSPLGTDSGEDSGREDSKGSPYSLKQFSPISNPVDQKDDLEDYLEDFNERAKKSEADAKECLMFNALQDYKKKYEEEAEKSRQLQADMDALTKQMEKLQSKYKGKGAATNDDDMKDADEENIKKAKKKKSNMLTSIRNKLKDGTLTMDMYLYLKTDCDTKITQNNVVKAYKAYKEMRGKDSEDDITFADMLVEMEEILL
jgi:hypothetical protein